MHLLRLSGSNAVLSAEEPVMLAQTHKAFWWSPSATFILHPVTANVSKTGQSLSPAMKDATRFAFLPSMQVQCFCAGHDPVVCLCDPNCVNLPVGSVRQALQSCAELKRRRSWGTIDILQESV